jgi:alpha-D-ribose 1-methylphosphonate 5-triphosphate synthase subunit PhnG
VPFQKDKTSIILRQQWIAVLTKSSRKDLEEALNQLPRKPCYHFIRQPETGAIMVRARAGGSGLKFNLGEMTLSRCVVKVDNGHIGCGYVMGRDHRHAELISVFDGLLQDKTKRPQILQSVIKPLEKIIRERKALSSKKIASTKVDFFTMVRGE